MRAQDTAEMSSLAFDQLIFAGHPYSRPEDGYPETVAKITRDDIAQITIKRILVQKGWSFPLLARSRRTRLSILSNPFSATGPIQINPTSLILDPIPDYPNRSRRKLSSQERSNPMSWWVGPPRLANHHDYMPVSLGNNILGQFGMYGRIGDVIREQSGLAYYAYTRLNSGIGPGIMGSLCRGEPGKCGEDHRLGQKRDQALCHRTGFGSKN